MANGETLAELIALARQEIPEISDVAWDRFLRIAIRQCGGSRIYVASMKKRLHLEAIAALQQDMTQEQVARLVGLSVRQVRRLMRLL